MLLSSKSKKPAFFQISVDFTQLRSRSFWLFLGLFWLAANGGCSTSGYYPVQGKIVDQAGQTVEGLEGSEIVFLQPEGKGSISSVGDIKADGTFRMYTERPGDGVPPGEYTVYIPRRRIDSEREAPQSIEAKFEKPESSGLRAKVEPKRNTFEFKVNRFSKK